MHVPPEWASCDDRGPSVVTMRLFHRLSLAVSTFTGLFARSHARLHAAAWLDPCFVSVQRSSGAGSFCFHQNGAALSVGVSSQRPTFSSEGRMSCKIQNSALLAFGRHPPKIVLKKPSSAFLLKAAKFCVRRIISTETSQFPSFPSRHSELLSVLLFS